METSVNNKCRAFTSLEQSRKLAEFLPLDSADMYYINSDINKIIIRKWKEDVHDEDDLPCWSLAALLEIIPRNLKIVLAVNDYWDGNAVKYKYAIGSVEHNNYDCYADNPIDACVAMIEILHGLEML